MSGADGVYDVYDDEDPEGPAVLALDATREIFDSTIEREDYAMGEKTQQTAENGALTHLVSDATSRRSITSTTRFATRCASRHWNVWTETRRSTKFQVV